MVKIRKADDTDFDGIWPIFHEIVSRGDTYAFSPDTDNTEAYEIWMLSPTATYVDLQKEQIIGIYFIKPNQLGLGSHVCNAGFMVSAHARGRGIGRAMGEHSLVEAKKLCFTAMRFNLVVSTNEHAVKL